MRHATARGHPLSALSLIIKSHYIKDFAVKLVISRIKSLVIIALTHAVRLLIKGGISMADDESWRKEQYLSVTSIC